VLRCVQKNKNKNKWKEMKATTYVYVTGLPLDVRADEVRTSRDNHGLGYPRGRLRLSACASNRCRTVPPGALGAVHWQRYCRTHAGRRPD
jgi:hypothetical protein